MHYKYENGRRYHAFGKEDSYTLPNDESEQDRLDLYHHIWSMVLKGELHTAPLDNPQQILDIGTGTGIWAIDMAEYGSLTGYEGTILRLTLFFFKANFRKPV